MVQNKLYTAVMDSTYSVNTIIMVYRLCAPFHIFIQCSKLINNGPR